MEPDIAGPASPPGELRHEPRDADAIRKANARWISSVVSPTFNQFAVGLSQQGYGAVVSSSGTGCEIEIGSPEDSDRFDVCVGVAAPESEQLDCRVPGADCPFGTRTRDEVDGAAIRYVLNGAIESWLARND